MTKGNGFQLHGYLIFAHTQQLPAGSWVASVFIYEEWDSAGAPRYAENLTEEKFETEAVARDNALRLASNWIHKNPARSFKPAADIEYLIRQRMAGCDTCARVQLAGVQWHVPDKSGCNWNIEWMNGSPVEVRQCSEEIAAFVRNLRRHYHISEPE